MGNNERWSRGCLDCLSDCPACGNKISINPEFDQFDAITLNQVVEHVAAPDVLIKNCFKYLKKDGLIWIALPNPNPNPNAMGYKVFGRSWAGSHPPYHSCLPSQKILVSWLKNAGFDGVEIINRGPHAKANWIASLAIAKKSRLEIKKSYVFYFYVAEFLSLFSSKWSEETVVMARKR